MSVDLATRAPARTGAHTAFARAAGWCRSTAALNLRARARIDAPGAHQIEHGTFSPRAAKNSSGSMLRDVNAELATWDLAWGRWACHVAVIRVSGVPTVNG